MTLDKAIHTAKVWADGGVCTLRDGEVQEYHKLALDALRVQADAENPKTLVEHVWKGVYMSSPSSYVGTCSVCGMSNDIPPPMLAHYCPNCGAKMDMKS